MALTLFTYACPDNTNIKSNTPIPACFSPIPFFHSFSFVGSGRQATQAVFWCDFWLVCTETNGFFYLFLFTSLFLPGIWSRDIRYKSNLPLTEINKILKNLESKKLIKAVKSVAVSILRLFFWQFLLHALYSFNRDLGGKKPHFTSSFLFDCAPVFDSPSLECRFEMQQILGPQVSFSAVSLQLPGSGKAGEGREVGHRIAEFFLFSCGRCWLHLIFQHCVIKWLGIEMGSLYLCVTWG